MGKQIQLWQWEKGSLIGKTGETAEEHPYTIHLNGEELVTLLASPGYQKELAAGFLFNEGIIRAPADILRCETDPAHGLIWVETAGTGSLGERFWRKRYLGSGCGGSIGFYSLADVRSCQPLETDLQVSGQQVVNLARFLQTVSTEYRSTRGVHTAIVADADEVLVIREDIGRHNAVDKVTGKCLLDGIVTVGKLLMVSGRISSEILTKAVRMGVPVLISRAAPTALAVEYGQQLGITVIGLARGSRFQVYTHPGRIKP